MLPNYYAILNVPYNTPPEAIVEAFMRLTENEQEFFKHKRQICEAYACLASSGDRAAYDVFYTQTPIPVRFSEQLWQRYRSDRRRITWKDVERENMKSLEQIREAVKLGQQDAYTESVMQTTDPTPQGTAAAKAKPQPGRDDVPGKSAPARVTRAAATLKPAANIFPQTKPVAVPSSRSNDPYRPWRSSTAMKPSAKAFAPAKPQGATAKAAVSSKTRSPMASGRITAMPGTKATTVATAKNAMASTTFRPMSTTRKLGSATASPIKPTSTSDGPTVTASKPRGVADVKALQTTDTKLGTDSGKPITHRGLSGATLKRLAAQKNAPGKLSEAASKRIAATTRAAPISRKPERTVTSFMVSFDPPSRPKASATLPPAPSVSKTRPTNPVPERRAVTPLTPAMLVQPMHTAPAASKAARVATCSSLEKSAKAVPIRAVGWTASTESRVVDFRARKAAVIKPPGATTLQHSKSVAKLASVTVKQPALNANVRGVADVTQPRHVQPAQDATKPSLKLLPAIAESNAETEEPRPSTPTLGESSLPSTPTDTAVNTPDSTPESSPPGDLQLYQAPPPAKVPASQKTKMLASSRWADPSTCANGKAGHSPDESNWQKNSKKGSCGFCGKSGGVAMEARTVRFDYLYWCRMCSVAICQDCYFAEMDQYHDSFE